MSREHEWRVCLFRSFRLERDGEEVARFGNALQDQLLAYLALHRGEPQGRLQIVELLWPGREVGLARNRLSEVLHLLNVRLHDLAAPEDGLGADKHAVWLSESMQTDVQKFEEALSRVPLEASAAAKAGFLGTAIALYGRGLLPVMTAKWTQPERARLKKLHEQACALLPDIVARGGQQALAALPPEAARLEFVELVEQEGTSGSVHAQAWSSRLPPPSALPRQGEGGLAVEEFLEEQPRWHLEQCIRMAEEAEPHLLRADRQEWLDQLEARHEKLKAGLDWAIEHDMPGEAVRLSGALWRFWYARNHIDGGRLYLERALSLAPEEETAWAARALTGSGALAALAGDMEIARGRLERARDIWFKVGDDLGLACCLNNLAIVHHKRGEYNEARFLSKQAIGLARGEGNAGVLLVILRDAALIEKDDGNYERAQRLLEECAELSSAVGDPGWIARAYANLATIAQHQGNLAAAAAAGERALRQYRALGDLKGMAFSALAVGCVAHEEGDYTRARTLYLLALQSSQLARHIRGAGLALKYLADLAKDMGDTGGARDGYARALEMLRAAGDEPAAAKTEKALADLNR